MRLIKDYGNISCPAVSVLLNQQPGIFQIAVLVGIVNHYGNIGITFNLGRIREVA
jgi:hypothetical protein